MYPHPFAVPPIALGETYNYTSYIAVEQGVYDNFFVNWDLFVFLNSTVLFQFLHSETTMKMTCARNVATVGVKIQ